MKGDLLKKHSALALIIALFVFLAACQSKQPPPSPTSFTATAQITFEQKRFTARLEQTCPGSLWLDFSAPAELKGMSIRIEGGTAIVQYGKMELSLPTPSLPQAGFAHLLNEVLLRLAQSAPESFRRTADGWELNAQADTFAYTAFIDTQGMLRTLQIPRAALTIELT